MMNKSLDSLHGLSGEVEKTLKAHEEMIASLVEGMNEEERKEFQSIKRDIEAAGKRKDTAALIRIMRQISQKAHTA